jgi:hypothetical protein
LLSDNGLDVATRVVFAILLFLGGWIVAKLVSYIFYRILCATEFDNKLAKRLGLDLVVRGREGEKHALERGIAKIVYYLLILLVIVAVLQYAGLTQVAGPIQRLVDTVIQALPFVGKAGLILVVAYFAGTILRIVVTTFLNRLGVDRRFAELAEDKPEAGEGTTPQAFSETAGGVMFWLMMVLGLAGAFEALEIGPVADPLRNAIDEVVGLLPALALAVLLIAAGYVLGRIVRAIVRNLLQSVGFDRVAARVGFDKLTGKTSPSDVMGIIALVFIMFHAIVAALTELGLDALSGPLTAMMAQFWTILPSLAVSTLIVVFGVVVGGMIRDVVKAALHNIGLDAFMAKLGFGDLAGSKDQGRDYSRAVGVVAQVAVIMIAVAQALENLELGTWAEYVTQLLIFGVRHVAVAILIVGIGFAVGNYVRTLIHARHDEKSEDVPAWLGEFARYAVLVFAFTMAVHQLGVAEDFVLLSFGLLFGSLCLALGLAFGLGGRDVASEIVKRRYAKARAQLGTTAWPGAGGGAPPTPPTSGPPPTGAAPPSGVAPPRPTTPPSEGGP